MEIEFDESKNAKNIEQHGLSFEQVKSLDWENALVVEDNRKDYGEVRFRAFIQDFNENYYSVAFTIRGENSRIISFRKARQKERKYYV